MTNGESFSAGEVVWAPDPYNDQTSGPRPWLVLAAESLPYSGEEYVCAGLTLSDLPDNLEVGDDWVAGGNPNRTSYCSPWVLATVKHDAVANPQGKVTAAFTRRVARRAVECLAGDLELTISVE